jgi:hypothetical protein
MTDLAERGSLGVGEFQLPFQLGPQDPIFGSQIFVPRPLGEATLEWTTHVFATVSIF